MELNVESVPILPFYCFRVGGAMANAYNYDVANPVHFIKLRTNAIHKILWTLP